MQPPANPADPEYKGFVSLPPLSGKLIEPTPVAAIGTALWATALVILVIANLLGVSDTPWIWTCVAGILLGAIGYGIFRWQRAAAQRGSRVAQDGLL